MISARKHRNCLIVYFLLFCFRVAEKEIAILCCIKVGKLAEEVLKHGGAEVIGRLNTDKGISFGGVAYDKD